MDLNEYRRIRINVGGVVYGDDTNLPFCEKCVCSDVGNNDQFVHGLRVYKALMHNDDLLWFNNFLERVGFDNVLQCFNCCDNAIKNISSFAKRKGARMGGPFTLLLDLFSLRPWVEYTHDDVWSEATKYTINCDMFKSETDQQLSDDIMTFLTKHVLLPGQAQMTLTQWLSTREWANKGTATDIDFSPAVDDIALKRDKAALAWFLEQETLELDAVLKNKVFPKRDRKKRIIVVGPTNEYLIGSYINRVCVENMVTSPFVITNLKTADGWRERMVRKLKSGALAFPMDQSAFDLNQRKIAVLTVKNWLIDRVFDMTGDRRLLDIKTWGDEVIVQDGREVELVWQNGLLSGKWYTAIAGSLLNAYEIWRAADRDWNMFNGETYHQGDDVSVFLNNIGDCYKIFDNCKRLGIKVNPDKNFADYYRTDYLHDMYMCGPARLECRLGMTDLQVLRYAARGMTSILWGDQDFKAESTTDNTQSMSVSKAVDRAYIMASRLMDPVVVSKVIKLLQLSKIECQFAATPACLGGLGSPDIVLKQQVTAVTIPTKYVGLVNELKGYEGAFNVSKAEFPKITRIDGFAAVEKTLSFKKLPGHFKAKVRRNYYNLKSVAKPIKLNRMMFSQVTMKRMDYLKLPTEPVLSRLPWWRALAEVMKADKNMWSKDSLLAYMRMQHAGKLVQRTWEKGKLRISSKYNVKINADQSSPIAAKFTQYLLNYVIAKQNTDMNSENMLRLMWSLEYDCHKHIREQSVLFYSW